MFLLISFFLSLSFSTLLLHLWPDTRPQNSLCPSEMSCGFVVQREACLSIPVTAVSYFPLVVSCCVFCTCMSSYLFPLPQLPIFSSLLFSQPLSLFLVFINQQWFLQACLHSCVSDMTCMSLFARYLFKVSYLTLQCLLKTVNLLIFAWPFIDMQAISLIYTLTRWTQTDPTVTRWFTKLALQTYNPRRTSAPSPGSEWGPACGLQGPLRDEA